MAVAGKVTLGGAQPYSVVYSLSNFYLGNLPDYGIQSKEVRSVGSVRECTEADGDVADTLQGEQRG